MREKEIGGYFELETFSGTEYYSNLIPLNNARNALAYVLKARKIKKIYLPHFLCDSVAKICEREGYLYEKYSIDEKFLPVFEKKLCPGEYLYIVNFYGQISNKMLKQLKKKYNNIIFDNVQAFFQKPLKGIDTIYSCRKFFGVPDGGYLATNANPLENLEIDNSKDRTTHLLGRFEENASKYYGDFKKNDSLFVDLDIRYMSKLTHNILSGIDYKKVKEKRNQNYAILRRALGKKNELNVLKPDGPYCYPFYCKNGMQIKKELANRKIYVPTLWPNVLQLQDTIEKEYAENILPLPCDQRYGRTEMRRIIAEVEKCLS